MCKTVLRFWNKSDKFTNMKSIWKKLVRDSQSILFESSNFMLNSSFNDSSSLSIASEITQKTKIKRASRASKFELNKIITNQLKELWMNEISSQFLNSFVSFSHVIKNSSSTEFLSYFCKLSNKQIFLLKRWITQRLYFRETLSLHWSSDFNSEELIKKKRKSWKIFKQMFSYKQFYIHQFYECFMTTMKWKFSDSSAKLNQ